MIGRRTVAFVVAASLACSGVGFAGVEAAGASASHGGVKCSLAQDRVDLLAARQVVAGERLVLLGDALTLASDRGKSARVTKIASLIATVKQREATRDERLQAIEKTCDVTPAP